MRMPWTGSIPAELGRLSNLLFSEPELELADGSCPSPIRDRCPISAPLALLPIP